MLRLPSILAPALLAGAAVAAEPPPASAFDGSRPFADQPVAPWAQSNATVGRIGGWRAYAREASGGPQAPETQPAAPAPQPAAPTPQGAASSPQHRHGH